MKSKQDWILHHFKVHGQITKATAATLYNVYGLGGIILRLRQKGYNIETVMIERHKQQSYACYVYKGRERRGV